MTPILTADFALEIAHFGCAVNLDSHRLGMVAEQAGKDCLERLTLLGALRLAG